MSLKIVNSLTSKEALVELSHESGGVSYWFADIRGDIFCVEYIPNNYPPLHIVNYHSRNAAEVEIVLQVTRHNWRVVKSLWKNTLFTFPLNEEKSDE